ncbi:MAG: type II toxin-antitoxin system HicA family toxin [Aestuariivita sp.]|nr:type II toxin-antitoxin system HicA family toxin [Aestuariivita sp.]
MKPAEFFRRMVEMRRRGSHMAMQKTDVRGFLTVLVPDHRELRKGTVRSIIRQSGVSRAVFEDMKPF